jgi:hypothetical protein
MGSFFPTLGVKGNKEASPLAGTAPFQEWALRPNINYMKQFPLILLFTCTFTKLFLFP